MFKRLLARSKTEDSANTEQPQMMRLRLIPSKMREYDGQVDSANRWRWVSRSVLRSYGRTLVAASLLSAPLYALWAITAASVHAYDFGAASLLHSRFLLTLTNGSLAYLYMLFMFSLELAIIGVIPIPYPKGLHVGPQGFRLGRSKRLIPWEKVKLVSAKKLIFRTMRQSTVLEFYLPNEPDDQPLSLYDRLVAWYYLKRFGNDTTFLDPETRKLRSNPYEGSCLRLPLDLFAFDSDKTNLFKAIRDHVSPENIDETLLLGDLDGQERPAGLAAIEETFTTIWLDELRTGTSTGADRSLKQGHTLQQGRYTIDGVLGHGGFSVVYSAKSADEMVAIKELVIGSGGTRASKEAILKQIAGEIELLKRLDHPNIVKCRDYFIESGRIYIVMQALQGLNLRDYVEQHGQLPEETMVEIAKQCCAILTYLHDSERKIVHRDFTPDNLIWDGERVMLIDFNVAEELNTKSSPTIVGKHCYLAPEQWSGVFSPTGDLYQLGCTLFFLGAAHDPQPLSQSDLQQERTDISQGLCTLIKALTEADETKRPADAAAVLHELLAVRQQRGAQ